MDFRHHGNSNNSICGLLGYYKLRQANSGVRKGTMNSEEKLFKYLAIQQFAEPINDRTRLGELLHELEIDMIEV